MDNTSDTLSTPPEKSRLTLGFLRLNDSAPLIMARELGLYRRHGLDVTLSREVSWANLRDKLVTGDLDAAQMLSPLPLATNLGLGGLRAPMCTGLGLSLNGNAITLGTPLSADIGVDPGSAAPDARDTVRALAEYLRRRRDRSPLTLAATHPYSCHHFQLRLWLRAGGIDPDHDVRIIALPPEQMVDSLSRGVTDGFCVGEPWNSIAVQQGVGVVHATGAQLWNNGLEKVLAVTEDWHARHSVAHLRLRMALMQACAWLAEDSHREQAVAVLARPEYLDLPEKHLRPALLGEYRFSKHSPPLAVPDFHVFGRYQAGFPWHSSGEWLLRQVAAASGRELADAELRALTRRTFRTDLYREAAQCLGVTSPGSDHKPHNQHAGPWQLEPGIEVGGDYFLQ